tara:strand:+ start:148 stop:363 length:216 start_codon:yes stop_codon:yes gene_type:complete
MLEINPKKFKHIQNKAIPSPLRPKFRNSNETNIYFLSKRKFDNEKKNALIKNIKTIITILIIVVGVYFLTN